MRLDACRVLVQVDFAGAFGHRTVRLDLASNDMPCGKIGGAQH